MSSMSRRTSRPDAVAALLVAITQAAQAANETHVSEGEARRWSPVVSAAEAVREERQDFGGVSA